MACQGGRMWCVKTSVTPVMDPARQERTGTEIFGGRLGGGCAPPPPPSTSACQRGGMMDPLPGRGLSSKGMRWLFMVRWMLMTKCRPRCHRCFMGGLEIYPRSAKPWPRSVTVIHPYCPLRSGSPMVARSPGQPLEQLVPPDPWVVTDHQLGAIDNMDSGSLATGIREQERRYLVGD